MRDDSRTRLLQSAGEIFAAKGFQAATVREICQKADANVAAVNYYFGDKQRLYIETVKEASRLRAQRVPMPQWGVDTPAEVKLTGFISTLLHRMIGPDSNRWQAQLMLRETLHPSEACRELAEEYFRPQFEALLSIVRELVPEGTPQHVVRQIGFSIVGQCLLYRVSNEVVQMLTPDEEFAGHFSPSKLAQHIAQFSLAALGVAPRKSWRTGRGALPDQASYSGKQS